MATLHQRLSLFSNAVRAFFNNWATLQTLVQRHQRGNEITLWLIKTVENLFRENDDLTSEEVAVFIDEIINLKLRTHIKDGSLEEISEKLCSFHLEIRNGQEAYAISGL